ncbi:PE family protein, partial [Mycobacterium kiyosense]|uniref:PE family protein n=1 Tax=Mycobacterium kiyosense TaxID=2871094 RepID=UPI00222E3C2E
MAFVTVAAAALDTATSDVAAIGNALGSASAAAANPTTGVLAAAEDEVSALIASFFSGHGQQFQTLSSQVAAFNDQFVAALQAASASYATAEATGVVALQSFAADPVQGLLNVINAPTEALLYRPLIGNGANGTPGTGQAGQAGGIVLGNGGNAESASCDRASGGAIGAVTEQEPTHLLGLPGS